ncbi:hypothetical protein Q604_UNBC12682G0001, partial [human gut metagenome]
NQINTGAPNVAVTTPIGSYAAVIEDKYNIE